MHDLCIQCDTLLLPDVFENLRGNALKFELDPAHFLPVPGLARQAYLKNTGVNLEFLTKIDML